MSESEIQIEMFPMDMRGVRIDPDRNMHRFYRMSVQRDLFGKATLIREWGRIGTRGRALIEIFADEGQAVDALCAIAARKRRRGYA